MSFREINQKYIEPTAQWTMIFGIVALCQPWIRLLHEWSVTITLVALATFIVSIHIPPPVRGVGEDETGPASPGSATEGHGNG
jgi:hypothetical protein